MAKGEQETQGCVLGLMWLNMFISECSAGTTVFMLVKSREDGKALLRDLIQQGELHW